MNPENILLAFLVFSLLGWVIEVFYRSYKAGKPTNPGFLRGPYVPIYGFGGFIAYLITIYSEALTFLRSALLFLVAVGLLEYLTGVFFKKVLRVKLWDYSNQWLNLKGHICPRFMFYWLVLGGFFRFILFPYFNSLIQLEIIGWQVFILGLIYGIVLVDLADSFNLAYKIKTTASEFSEEQVFPRAVELKDLYRELSYELNRRVNGEGAGKIKKPGIYLANYFRVTRQVRDNLKEVLRDKLEEITDNT